MVCELEWYLHKDKNRKVGMICETWEEAKKEVEELSKHKYKITLILYTMEGYPTGIGDNKNVVHIVLPKTQQ